jgi:hypothetical protein
MFSRILYITADDPAGMTVYKTQNGMITGEWWIRKDLIEAIVT